MGDASAISWTDATWNPVRGCTRVSQGCVNCYAESQAARIVRMDRARGVPKGEGSYDGLVKLDADERPLARWTGTVRMVPEHLADPIRWKRPRRIFVNSMSDLFHESLPDEDIAKVFGIMAIAQHHTFQILTKRAERMRDWFRWVEDRSNAIVEVIVEAQESMVNAGLIDTPPGWKRWTEEHHHSTTGERLAPTHGFDVLEEPAWPLPNVWLGTSVEDQPAADRIRYLQATPAAVRFLSCEPLLGPIELPQHDQSMGPSYSPLDWVIVGCESGPGARPADVGWFRSLRDQCADTRVPFFLKQATAHSLDRVLAPPTAPPEIIELVTSTGTRWCDQVATGPGSKRKAGGVIELPYLDGVQHAAFPKAAT